ncbi:odorant receptor 131-2-like [Acipenser ruthenus]|uniref:odorant receptor 131-2-like n=1 Tax=Acipenser ruthenus TaxID=7906 RepID=UPI0027415EE5|nr:odorant receptor 131-2-like [Acipenser ruthenus]
MVNVSGQSLDSLIHQQDLMVEKDWVFVLKVSFALATPIFFTYVNCIMLFTLYSKASFRETSRYILFAHMLFNDSILLMTSVLLYILALANQHIMRGLCVLLVLISGTTFINSPLNLAVMALERYIAICLPLRHCEISTPKRTGVVIGVIWVLSSLEYVSDLLAVLATQPSSFFLLPVYCTREMLFGMKWQPVMRQVFDCLFFLLVSCIIIYTYVAIMLQARCVSSDKASVSKARNTVLLHGVQLLLCLSSFLYGVIEVMLARLEGSSFIHMRYVSFMVLIILPRCLSPLIYSLRDENFRKLFKYYFTFASSKIKPLAGNT